MSELSRLKYVKQRESMMHLHNHIEAIRKAEKKAKNSLKLFCDIAPVAYFGYNRFLRNNLVSGFYSDHTLTVNALDAGGGIPFADQKGLLLKSGIYRFDDVLKSLTKENFDPKEQRSHEILNHSYLIVNCGFDYDECFYLEVDKAKASQNPISMEELKTYALALKQSHCLQLEDLTRSAFSYKKIGEKNCTSQKNSRADFNFLTEKQKIIFELVSRTYPNREIAAKLQISVKTVEGHIERLKHLLHVDTRWEMAEKYRKLFLN